MDQPVRREVRREEKFSLDDVSYVMLPGNAADAIAMVRKLGPLFADISLVLDAKGNLRELAVGKVLAHLDSAEADEILDFIMKNTRGAAAGGQPFSLGDPGVFAAHFGNYPAHWVSIVQRGFMFQFSRFFPAGSPLFQRIRERALSYLAAE